MDSGDLEVRFQYHAPTPEIANIHSSVRLGCFDLALFLNKWLPEGREKSLAITHLEEVMLWSNAAIARNHSAVPVPEREE